MLSPLQFLSIAVMLMGSILIFAVYILYLMNRIHSKTEHRLDDFTLTEFDKARLTLRDAEMFSYDRPREANARLRFVQEICGKLEKEICKVHGIQTDVIGYLDENGHKVYTSERGYVNKEGR